MGNYTILKMFENPRRGRQARNFTRNVPKILDVKSSSEQIFSENCRWVPLLECHSRRGNLKFCGIKEREHESNEDTKDLLRKFLRTDLKIPKKDEESIQFDTVQRVSARRVSSGSTNSKPRPIIVKLSSFHDEEFVQSFIKNLTKGCNLGISDDFPKEVEEMRKKRYPVLKAAKGPSKGPVVCFANQISSMRSQSTRLKFRGKLWSFCSNVPVFVFFFVSS